MKTAVAVAALLLAFALTVPGARAEDAPAAVRAALRPNAISLRWEKRDLGGEAVYLHLSVVPKARNKYAPNAPEPGHEKDPITRADITPGMALESSPFVLEVWTRAPDGTLRRRHALPFTEEGDVVEITTRWLEPKAKRGPILLLHFGTTHWHRWLLAIFPDGVRGKRALQQTFLWGGEGETGVTQRFDSVDLRGVLQVRETRYDDGKITRRTYRWDGSRFR